VPDGKPAIAVFGAGRMGSAHARTVALSARADLAGVADVDVAAAQRVVSSLKSGRVDTTQAFLSDPHVDAVIIATSSDTHAGLVVQAASAGKQIFCEKPISLDVETTVRAIRACDDAGVMMQIGFQRRFDRDFLNARGAIDAGKVGEIRFVRLVSRDRTLPPMAYIPTSGGQFKDQMIHDFDAARWLLRPAEVEDVTATGSAAVAPEIGEAGDVDTAVAVLRFSGGAIAVTDVSREAVYGYDVRTEIHGSRGMLLIGADGMQNGRILDASFAKPQTDSFLTRFSDAYRAEIEDFIEVIAAHGRPRVDGRDALQALRIAVAADRSRHAGCTVKLSDVEGM
jgi:myo-inositol 2-dehydrogenase/D-chiro-inositol 1-dehydrogenase